MYYNFNKMHRIDRLGMYFDGKKVIYKSPTLPLPISLITDTKENVLINQISFPLSFCFTSTSKPITSVQTPVSKSVIFAQRDKFRPEVGQNYLIKMNLKYLSLRNPFILWECDHKKFILFFKFMLLVVIAKDSLELRWRTSKN